MAVAEGPDRHFFENGKLVSAPSNLEGQVEEKPRDEWYSLFGEKVITKDGDKPTKDVVKGKKLVGLYFSAGWCGPCKRFTPKLAELYNRRGSPDDFEVIFLSACNDKDMFQDYYSHMPWPAVSYETSQGSMESQGVGFVRKAKREAGMQQGVLGKKFDIQFVPRLVLLDGSDGSVIAEEAMKDADNGGYEWLQADGTSEGAKVWQSLSGQ